MSKRYKVGQLGSVTKSRTFNMIHPEQQIYQLFIDSNDSVDLKDQGGGIKILKDIFTVKFRPFSNITAIKLTYVSIPASFFVNEDCTFEVALRSYKVNENDPVIPRSDYEIVTPTAQYLNSTAKLNALQQSFTTGIRNAIIEIVGDENHALVGEGIDIVSLDMDLTRERITISVAQAYLDILQVNNVDATLEIRFAAQAEPKGYAKILGFLPSLNDEPGLLFKNDPNFKSYTSDYYPDLQGPNYIYIRVPQLPLVGGSYAESSVSSWKTQVLAVIPVIEEGKHIHLNADWFEPHFFSGISNLDTLTFDFVFHNGNKVDFHGENVVLGLEIIASI